MMTRSPDSAISCCMVSTVPSITSSSSACRLSLEGGHPPLAGHLAVKVADADPAQASSRFARPTDTVLLPLPRSPLTVMDRWLPMRLDPRSRETAPIADAPALRQSPEILTPGQRVADRPFARSQQLSSVGDPDRAACRSVARRARRTACRSSSGPTTVNGQPRPASICAMPGRLCARDRISTPPAVSVSSATFGGTRRRTWARSASISTSTSHVYGTPANAGSRARPRRSRPAPRTSPVAGVDRDDAVEPERADLATAVVVADGVPAAGVEDQTVRVDVAQRVAPRQER